MTSEALRGGKRPAHMIGIAVTVARSGGEVFPCQLCGFQLPGFPMACRITLLPRTRRSLKA